MLDRSDLPPAPAGKTGWPWERYGGSEARIGDEAIRWPKITIVTPSFNQGRFLEQTLRSVLLQDYPNLEYLVLDGRSSDHSIDILRRYAPHLAYWHSQPDSGQADAIASGFERGTGEIHGYLNSDDILLPGALRHVARLFVRFPKTGVVYGNRLVIDNEGMVIGRHVWPYLISSSHWAIGQPLAQESTFWRKGVYWHIGGIDRTKFFVLDYDLFYRMWMATKFRKTREFLGCIRVHGDTKRSRHDEIRLQEMATAKLHYALREPGYLRIRIMNRVDRIQLLFESAIGALLGHSLPGIDGHRRGK